MFKRIRAARRTRRAYELAWLEMLMAENQARRDELKALERCPMCEAMESPEQREVCADQFRA